MWLCVCSHIYLLYIHIHVYRTSEESEDTVFGEDRVVHLFSFLSCVFGEDRVVHLFSFLSCVFGEDRVVHLFSFVYCVLFVFVQCLDEVVYPMLPVSLDVHSSLPLRFSLTFI